MFKGSTLFDLFGGIRPMARALEVPPSNVSAWKRAGCVPAQKQAHVLAVGQAKGLPITAEDVVFPLGRATDELPSPAAAVACDPQAEMQSKDAA